MAHKIFLLGIIVRTALWCARRSAGRDAGELLGLPATALAEVGSDHRLADPEPLAAMLRTCGQVAAARRG
jgi:hypothetical protein